MLGECPYACTIWACCQGDAMHKPLDCCLREFHQVALTVKCVAHAA